VNIHEELSGTYRNFPELKNKPIPLIFKGNRAKTKESLNHPFWILSPLRLPIPPPRRDFG
jgi:hypothetical protein